MRTDDGHCSLRKRVITEFNIASVCPRNLQYAVLFIYVLLIGIRRGLISLWLYKENNKLRD
jgi:hypothetical protein